VPEVPGTYIIYRIGEAQPTEQIIDIGECGPRPRSKPRGLRGRIASAVPHSASERMAEDIARGDLRGELRVVWRPSESKKDSKQAQDALITLFRREFARQPRYNCRREHSSHPESFEAAYLALKAFIRGERDY
jgi:hypothetical protein